MKICHSCHRYYCQYLVVVIDALKVNNDLNVVNKDTPGDDRELSQDEDLSLMSQVLLPVLVVVTDALRVNNDLNAVNKDTPGDDRELSLDKDLSLMS